MNYIYDIILNFSNGNLYYDFFEWKSDDNLINVKKIPIFYVSKNTINDFINSDINVSANFIKNIHGKSIMSKNDQNKYMFICLLSDKEKTIGVRFSSNGRKIGVSSMLIDEENDCNTSNSNNYIINYIKKKTNNNFFISRDEYLKKKYLKKEIKKIYYDCNYNKLKYLYYEFYNEIIDDNDIMYKSLIDSLNDYSDKHNILYDLLVLNTKITSN